MNRLQLKKNALNKKTAQKIRVFQTHLRDDFLERIVRAIRCYTVYILLPSITGLHITDLIIQGVSLKSAHEESL